jgi:hypothetical protein
LVGSDGTAGVASSVSSMEVSSTGVLSSILLDLLFDFFTDFFLPEEKYIKRSLESCNINYLLLEASAKLYALLLVPLSWRCDHDTWVRCELATTESEATSLGVDQWDISL